jgi:hypothetical protein
MYIIMVENTVGYEDGYSISDVFGPFSNYDEAEAVVDRYETKMPFGERMRITKISSVSDLERQMNMYLGESNV